MKDKKKIIITVIVLLIIIIAIVLAFKFFKKEENREVTNKTTVMNSIETYGYTLDDRDSDLYKNKFEQLQKLLETEDYDIEEYISLISEMYIIDFFSLANKVSKYDVGGMEFVHSTAYDSLLAKTLDTLYKYVNDNSYGDRIQELPTVNKVEVIRITKDTYSLNNSNVVSYKVDLEWNYEKDLGYQKSGTLTFIQEDFKYAVIAFQ